MGHSGQVAAKRKLASNLLTPSQEGAGSSRAPAKAGDKARTQTVGAAPVVPSSKIRAAAGLVVVVVCAAYANSLHGPFLFDDLPSVVDNKSIRHLGSAQVLAAPPDAITTSGRPVVNFSLAINFAIGGLAVEGYHAVNLAVHILAALVLFALVRRTLLVPTLSAQFGAAATELALAVALLWAIHPLQTESVTYIVQRAEAIAGLFYLLVLYSFLRGATAVRGKAWYAVAVATCALGMASKEIMVSAPLMAVLFDRTFIAGSFRESLRRRWGLWLALASTWVLLFFLHHMSHNRNGSAGFGLGVTVWQYARTQFGCIIHYLQLAFWPSPLVLDYGRFITRNAAAVPYAVGVLALGVATAAGLRRKWGFLGVWFFAILAPTSSVVPLPGQTEAEHRMYLPLAAVVAIVVLSAYRVALRLRSPRAMSVLVPATAAALAFGTYQRNKDYQSDLAIWSDNIRNRPRNDRAYLNRGGAYWNHGRREEALGDYDRCIALNSKCAEAYIGRGYVYIDQGRYDEALAAFEHALKLKPELADGYNGRGEVFGHQGMVDAAIREYDRAIELDPELAQAHYNRANAYHAKGALDLAIDSYDRVIRLRPDYAKAYNSRGLAYDSKGLVDAAIRDYDRAIVLLPDFAEAYSNRCSAQDVKGQSDAAVKDCDRAILLRPNFAEAYNNRGNAFQSEGQYAVSIKDYDKAIELNPDFAAAYQNRAMARSQTKAYDKAWADVRMLRKLGGTPIPRFVEDLMEKSGWSE
jgi:tetratricopeptide (TPR) repeat protein